MIGFVSLDVVCDELNDCAWNICCSSFLSSVCMFTVSKALLISSTTVIIHAGGAIWLNPFTIVLFSVCSAVTVECCVLSRQKTLCRYGCMYFLAALVLVCVDVIVMSSA